MIQGKQHKSSADQAFKEGKYKNALSSYHFALTYLKGLNRNSPATANTTEGQEKPKNEVEVEIAKIYSNQSACHFKLANWKRVVECADDAIRLDKDNTKAKFRKAIANAEMGYTENAISQLETLLKEDPASSPSINTELAKIRVKDKERQKAADKKLKGFLSKDKPLFPDEDKPKESKPSEKKEAVKETSYRPASPAPEATIEEVKD
ncbi:TPR-like protein [Schizopora paradoxa]|uniref:TPR-like protein n=1 Tax=Schizopora paradoxa TaxID=27342 RepID=A0A0H2RVW4_9AGAM|nr:TPR-like protein [Schizopora paradoxa]